MAKQRRVPSSPARQKAAQPIPDPAPAAGRAGLPSHAATPSKRTSYVEAVALYEQGLQALQRHEYTEAADLLRSVLARYPEEKELTERVHQYLNICARQATPQQSGPRTLEERLFAATLAINAGSHDEARPHLQVALTEDPENDHALYMLAVVHAVGGAPEEALQYLLRAVELNPENRSLARQDPDLDSLRDHDGFRRILDMPLPRLDRRRPPRRLAR